MRAIRTAFIGKRGGAYASLLAARGGGLRVQTAFSSRPPPLSRILFSCFFIDFVKGFLLKNGLRAGNPQGAGHEKFPPPVFLDPPHSHTEKIFLWGIVN
jgi:hypothetical protein